MATCGRVHGGRDVVYGYGTTGGADDRLSRISSIGDGTNTHATYQYLGTGTVVVEDYVEPEVRLDYRGTSHAYSGFDRFGRVADQLWRDYGNSPQDADRFLYGYDGAGNRLWRENDVAANLGTPIHLDELYDYDELYQLIAVDRGNLDEDQYGKHKGRMGSGLISIAAPQNETRPRSSSVLRPSSFFFGGSDPGAETTPPCAPYVRNPGRARFEGSLLRLPAGVCYDVALQGASKGSAVFCGKMGRGHNVRRPNRGPDPAFAVICPPPTLEMERC